MPPPLQAVLGPLSYGSTKIRHKQLKLTAKNQVVNLEVVVTNFMRTESLF